VFPVLVVPVLDFFRVLGEYETQLLMAGFLPGGEGGRITDE